jgi:[acyl-carrier-protein] S-malonyltransferase
VVVAGANEGVAAVLRKLDVDGHQLAVSHAFHSPLMAPAAEELQKAIESTNISKPFCPVYQNVSAKATTNVDEIRKNLIEQLISPVRWTQSVKQMVEDGATTFTELGPGKVLSNLIKKISPESTTL